MSQRRWLEYLVVAPLGLLAGAACVLAALYWFPFAHLTRTARVLPAFGAGQHVETYTLIGRLDGDRQAAVAGRATILAVRRRRRARFEGQQEAVAGDYRQAVETYYKVIAEKAKQQK